MSVALFLDSMTVGRPEYKTPTEIEVFVDAGAAADMTLVVNTGACRVQTYATADQARELIAMFVSAVDALEQSPVTASDSQTAERAFESYMASKAEWHRGDAPPNVKGEPNTTAKQP